MENYILNMLPDPPDVCDRIYNPPLRGLKPVFNSQPDQDERWIARVKDQGLTPACAGFALAAMVETLAFQAWNDCKTQGDAPEQISPYMLYYMARRYEEIPGDDLNSISTARATMKAWHKHGACKKKFWDSIDIKPGTADQEWVPDAFKTPLGAYYRVDHSSIPDLHAAINEVGVVYATAMTHQGWRQLETDGSIPFNHGSLEIGGHAFLLIGYDEKGFWIQNSWGRQWGKEGFAHLSYADWSVNGMDAWVGQLGVQISSQLASLTQGLNYEHLQPLRETVAIGSNLLSSNPNVSAQQINSYVVELENNGRLSHKGKFFTSEEDLEKLVTSSLEAAIGQWNLQDNEPIDIGLYAHGGLTPESGAETTAKRWVPALFAWKIFPIFFMWQTGLLDTVNDCLEDVLKTPRTTAGTSAWKPLVDGEDNRIESLVSKTGTLAWDEMKKNAEMASNNQQGGLRLLYDKLLKVTKPEIRSRLRLHLIGHSAGAIFQAHLLPKLLEGGLHVDGIYFMGSACRVELFKTKVLPSYQNGKVATFTQFHLADTVEQKDNCFGLYHKSLLYLVSNAFEHNRGIPLLGMEKFFLADPELTQKPTGAEVWQWVTCPTIPIPPNPADGSTCTTHGGFCDDDETMRAILTRISNRPKVLSSR